MQLRFLSLLVPIAALPLTWDSLRVEPSIQQPVELRLHDYVGPLRSVEAVIAGRPGRFLLDTGGGFTVVTPKAAAAAGATTFGRGTGFRHDGTRVDGARGTPIALSLGGFVREAEVGILDLATLLQGLPPIDGIVSLETFAGRAVTFDFARSRMWVETAASLQARVAGMKELQVRFGRQGGGAALDVFVAVTGVHGPQWFELDCGNTQGVLVAPHAVAELGIPAATPGTATTAEVTVAGLGKTTCKVIVKEMIYDGLLDAGFFQRHVISIDLGAGRAWARAN